MRRRDIRRLELGFVVFSFGEHATWLAVLVFALQRGGAGEVGAVAVVQLVPGVFLAPLAAYAGDRFAPQRALAVGYGAQCVSMAATAAAMWAGAPLVAYAAATVAATCVTFTRPVMGSILPTVTHRPADLIAANTVTGVVEQFGLLGGPLVAGAVMAVSSPAMVFAVAGAGTGVSALLVLGVDPIERSVPAGVGAADVLSQAFGGFAALGRNVILRALIWLVVCAGIIQGIADVVFVTFAEDRLGGGGGQTGLLAGAYGLGAVAGSLGFSRLAAGGSVSRFVVTSAVLAGAAMLGVAAIDALVPALVAFAVLGSGETLLSLTAKVTVQRQAPLDVLTRIFGVGEGLQMGSVAVGSLTVSVLIASWSLTLALVWLAAAVCVAVLIGFVVVRRHGDDIELVDQGIIDRLLEDPIFDTLAAPTVERLARAAEQLSVPAGAVVVAEGERGDRYYLVLDGRATVTSEDRLLRVLDDGDSFGAIALVRDVGRTATVRAISPLTLLGVPREDFLEAVTGSPRSLRTVTTIVDRHLST